jgi:hypothetical protein
VSIATAKAALAAVLAGITTPASLTKIYERPKWATSIGEFPCALISSALVRHDYTLRIWLLVGTTQTPIDELTDRAEQWIEPLMVALAAALTLHDEVQHIGERNTDGPLWTYTMGAMQWGLTEGSPSYWGLRVDLPITELLGTPTEA